MGRPVHQKYKVIVNVMYVAPMLQQPSRRLNLVYSLESGILYPITTVVAVLIPLITDPGLHGNIPFDLAPVACLFSVRTSISPGVYTDEFHFNGSTGLRTNIDYRTGCTREIS